MWSSSQRERLAWEHQVLQQQGMSQFSVFHNPEGDRYDFYGTTRSSSGRDYDLWSPIPSGYPNERPPLYVAKPCPLLARDGSRISSLGVNHSMHTLAPTASGLVQVCHWRGERWHAAIPLYKVALKGLLWLEAYEQHLATGSPIDAFVRTMSGT